MDYCAFAIWKITYFLVPESTERFQLVMFFIDDAQLRSSSSCATPNSFFIGAHGQELSVPRHSTLIQPSLWCPEIRGSVAHPSILELLWARFKHLLEVVWWIWDHFWYVIQSSTLHFRPQIFNQRRNIHWQEKQPSLECLERWGCLTG